MKRKASAIIVLVLLILIAGAAFVGYKYFRVETITVFGNENFTAEEMIELSGVEYGTNLFMVDETEVAERFASSPVVVFEKLVRKYPTELELYVRERKAVVMIAYIDSNLILDNELVVMDTGTEESSYPVLTGIQITSFQLGQQLVTADEFQLKTTIRLLEALENDYGLDIARIDVSNTSNLLLYTQSGMAIKLGNIDDIEAKLQRTQTIYGILTEQGKTSGTLDVTTGSGGSYLPSTVEQPESTEPVESEPSVPPDASQEPVPTGES